MRKALVIKNVPCEWLQPDGINKRVVWMNIPTVRKNKFCVKLSDTSIYQITDDTCTVALSRYDYKVIYYEYPSTVNMWQIVATDIKRLADATIRA